MYYLKLADYILEFNNKHEYLFWRAKEYQVENPTKTNVSFTIPIELIDQGVSVSNEPRGLVEGTEMQRLFSEWLPLHDAFLMHSATFDVDGVGVAFAAHSGTGKTTHMNLWQQLLGDRMVVVNGDKPIVRFFDEEPNTPYAYGTPWNGKERLGCNMRTPLKHICFIERSETNYVEKVQKQDVINRIFNQVYMPKDPVAVANTMTLIDRLLSCTDLWIIHCNMEPSAAEVAYNTIINGKISVGNDQCVVP